MKLMQTTIKLMKRSPFQVTAAVMTITMTLLVISVFSLLSFGSIKVLSYFEAAPQVIAFFKPGEDLDDNQIANIKAQLEKTGKLNDFRYVSTREAEAIYKDKNKDNPLLLELVDYNILPASIEISAMELSDLSQLNEILSVQEGVDDVVFYEDVIESLGKWIRSVKDLGLGVITYLSLESILVVLVVIGMQIATKRDEIEIQRLLGATRSFIIKPFIFSGVLYGLVSSFIAWGLSYLLLLYSTPFLANWLQDIPILPVPFWFMMALLAGELLFGGVIGLVSSLIATRRFLKE